MLTKERVEYCSARLIRFAEMNIPLKTQAKELELTASQVYRLRAKLGLANNKAKAPKPSREKLIEHRHLLLTDAEKIFGCSGSTISRWYTEEGIARGEPKNAHKNAVAAAGISEDEILSEEQKAFMSLKLPHQSEERYTGGVNWLTS